MRLRRTRSATRTRAATLTIVLALTAVVAIAASPASATGQPVPPFEDETWLIDITHSDEYWLNVRYNVFRPGWDYSDQGYSGAHVTGHSGCGEDSLPMLVNTAYAAEGTHEIIVYWGSHCTHWEDADDENKYDLFPDGTPIAVSATFEHYLPGETSPSETLLTSGTVTVTGDAPPPVSLGSIVVDRSDPLAGAADSSTSSSTTASDQDDQDAAAEDPEGAATGIDSDVSSDQATPASTDDERTARWVAALIIAVGLALGVAAAVLMVKEILRRRTPVEKAASAREAAVASEWFGKQATHTLIPGATVVQPNPDLVALWVKNGKSDSPGLNAPLPPGLELMPTPPRLQGLKAPISIVVRDPLPVIYDPVELIAVLPNGTQVLANPRDLDPLQSGDFVPTGELIGPKHVEGRAGDKVVAYPPGTPIQLITTTGDQALVRVDAKTEIWVPRSSIGAATATAQIDPPSAPAPSG